MDWEIAGQILVLFLGLFAQGQKILRRLERVENLDARIASIEKATADLPDFSHRMTNIETNMASLAGLWTRIDHLEERVDAIERRRFVPDGQGAA